MKKQDKSVVIEMAATMLKAGIDYALEHQVELMASFDKMSGKKGKATPRKKAPVKAIDIAAATT